MSTKVNVELTLPDEVLGGITLVADNLGMSFDELVEVVLIDYMDGLNMSDDAISSMCELAVIGG